MEDEGPLGQDQLFRLFAGSVQDYAMYMLRPDGRIATWNVGAERLTAYAPGEVIDRDFGILFNPEDRAAGRPARALERAAAEERHEEEGWRVRKDGDRFWAHVTVTAVRDEAGRLAAYGVVTRDLTERNEAEEELRRAAERFRDVAESIHEVFWITAPDTSEVLYVSPAYERVWGQPVEAAYADPSGWVDLVHPDDRGRVEEVLSGLGETEYDLEFRIIRSGVVRWVHVRGFPVRDEAGVVRRVVGVAEDVTARREREEEQRYLAEAGRILSSSLEYQETLGRVARLVVPVLADWCAVYLAQDGELRLVEVAHRDPDRAATAWHFRHRYAPDPAATSGTYKVFSSGVPEVVTEISDALLDEISPDPEFRRMIQRLGLRSVMNVPIAARGRVLGVLSLIAAESGRRYDADDLAFAEALASRAALAIDNARLHRATEAARGEAERRAREEEALRAATAAVSASFTVEDVIRQISESALTATNSDGAFVERIDFDGDEVEVVAVAGERVPTIGTRQPYSGSYVELVVEGTAPEVIPRLELANRPFSGEIVERCPHCSGLVVPLVNAGEPIGALILVREPERLHFRPDEAARALTFGDLAALAFRKVHILEESERRREELEQVTESRARLIRGFSHDLKNPLGAAEGILDLIDDGLMGEISDRALDGVVRARRAIRSAIDLLDDVLDLARAEAGQIEIRQAPVDVREAAREIAEEYRARAEKVGLELEVDLPPVFPVITSDGARIRQILGNLISNAVKYTPPGGRVKVRAEVWRCPPDGGRPCAAVMVSDTGPGIPEDQQRFLFREFTRLEAAGTTAGAGIGLAISKRIAHALGGDLTADTARGQGSTFTLSLPLTGERAEPDAER